ncbi:hypothetical protein [Mesorhizobium sp. BR1-1-16]|nr:hypothetical protein [Mesorhizobium sp. BR1-1-16]
MSFLWLIPVGANAEAQAHRMMDLALDGLARPQAPVLEFDEDRTK